MAALKAIFDIVLRNGLLLIAPAILISLVLWPYLPKVFSQQAFDEGIPVSLLTCENLLRMIVFFCPVLLISNLTNKAGWIVYGTGIILYILSYLIQIYLSNTGFGQSVIAFTAPAWTTIIWFTGIGILCSQSYLPVKKLNYAYIALSVLFTVIHTSHAVLVFLRTGKTA